MSNEEAGMNRRGFVLGIPAAVIAGALGKSEPQFMWKAHKVGVHVPPGDMSRIVFRAIQRNEEQVKANVSQSCGLLNRLKTGGREGY